MVVRFSAVLIAVFAWCLLAATGCARPPDGQDQGEMSRQAGDPNDQAVELPKPESAQYGGAYWPPPVWLISGDRAVQASYGEFCESDMCGGEVVPKRVGGDPATGDLPAGEPAMVVVGESEPDDLAAGVVGWQDLPSVQSYLTGVSTGSGLPYFMRGLEARRVPDEERPAVRLAGERPGDGLTVFELPSTGNTGDRLLSVFLTIQDDPASYHLRLDPGQPGENPPPPRETFPGTVAEISSTPETVTRPMDDTERTLAVGEKTEIPLGDSPGSVEFGAGYLWVLDGSRLLKVDPATVRTVSATSVPETGGILEVGAGAVWVVARERDLVLRLDPKSGEVSHKIEVNGPPSEIAATSEGIWVANYEGTQSGNLTKIDPETNEVVAEIGTPGIAESVAVDEKTGDVWAVVLDQTKGYVDYESSQLVRVDAGGDEVFARYTVEGGVSDVIAAEGQIWPVDDGLKMIDPRTEEIRTVVPLKPSDPYEMEAMAGSLWVAGGARWCG